MIGHTGESHEPGYARLVFYTSVRDYPSLADQKATALLAANGLLVSVLLFLSRHVFRLLVGTSHGEALVLGVALALVAGLLITAIVHSVLALTLLTPPMPGNPTFFRHIAGQPFGQYESRMRALGWEPALRELLIYNHTVSVLSVRKFELVDRAVSCLRIAFVLWLLLLLRVAFGGS